jgi:hypothetical protein
LFLLDFNAGLMERDMRKETFERLWGLAQQSKEKAVQWMRGQLTQEKLVQLLVDAMRATVIAIIAAYAAKALGSSGIVERAAGWLAFGLSIASTIPARFGLNY